MHETKIDFYFHAYCGNGEDFFYICTNTHLIAFPTFSFILFPIIVLAVALCYVIPSSFVILISYKLQMSSVADTSFLLFIALSSGGDNIKLPPFV